MVAQTRLTVCGKAFVNTSGYVQDLLVAVRDRAAARRGEALHVTVELDAMLPPEHRLQLL